MANQRPNQITSGTTAMIQPPKPLDVESADTNMKWDNFRSDFENYCSISGIDQYPIEREGEKFKLFMMFVGEAAREKYRNFELTEEDKAKPIAEILNIIARKVKKDQPVLLERLKFSELKQEEDEKYEDFVKRVDKASKLCDFENLTREKMIRDRVIFGSSDKSLIKKFFEKKESELTLDLVKQMGEANEATSKFMNKVSQKEATVQMVQSKADAKGRCKFCGEKHQAGSKNCPAYGKTCEFCKRKNHNEKVCYKKKSNNESSHSTNRKKLKKVDQIDEGNSSEASVGKIIDRSAEGRGVQAELKMKFDNEWSRVNCDLDTGAEACIIGYDFLCEMMKTRSPKLDQSNMRISDVSNQQIRVKGSVKIPSKLKKKVFYVRFQVVELNHGPLLSANACKTMGLVKFCNKVLMKTDRSVTEINIPDGQIKEAQDIINRYRDVVSDEIGKLPGKAKIEVDPNIPPVHQRPRRFPTAKREQLKKELEKLVKNGIITRQEEPTDFLSNVLMVRKGDNFRICLDPILLNQAIRRPNRQFTTIDEILPELTKAKIFTTVDASKGFWQVELDDESSVLTTFSTPFGNYRWLRLPFGISSSPEIFQMKLSEAMVGLKSTEALADDILIFGCGDSIEEAMIDHNIKLEALLLAMRKNNCKLNREKLKLCQKKVKFFGHYLTTDGLKPDDSKIRAIKEFPVPKDKKALQRFLGMVTYLGRYIDNLSQQTATLRKLTLNRAEWNWQQEEQTEFERLKEVINNLTNHQLQYFDINKEIIMECDASNEGLGVILYQDEKPLAYASRTLSNAERNGYAMIEKEMAAIVFGCTRFHQMLIGNRTLVRTDHKPLINITSKPMISAPKRLQMMMLVLQKYDLKYQFVKGKDNIVADTLSRAPVEITKRETINEDKGANVYEIKHEATIRQILETVNLANYVKARPERIEEFKRFTKEDQTLLEIQRLILNGWPEENKKLRDDVKAFHKFREEMAFQEGLVFRGNRIVVPAALRTKMIERLHLAHNGIEATTKLANNNLYWPGMTQQIIDKVKMCEICAKFSASQRKQPMQSHQIPKYPFQYISMDCCEEKIKGKKKNLLITVDHYSDFFELNILEDMTPTSVIKAMKSNFARYGISEKVCTDNGTNFNCKQMEKFARDYDFEHRMSSPNHQQGNGKAEAAVKIAKNLIKKAEENGNDYELALLHWRNTPNKIGSSPSQRFLSRRTQTLIPTTTKNLQPKVVKHVPEAIQERRESAKYYYDKKTQARPDLMMGQPVWVQLKHDRNDIWTPATVTNQLSDRAYEVETNQGTYRRDSQHIKPQTVKEDGESIESDTSFQSAHDETPIKSPSPSKRTLRDRKAIKPPSRLNL